MDVTGIVFDRRRRLSLFLHILTFPTISYRHSSYIAAGGSTYVLSRIRHDNTTPNLRDRTCRSRTGIKGHLTPDVLARTSM